MSPRRTRLLIPLLAAALGLPAAEQPTVMELQVSDGARLLQRWDASIYAKLWNDRVLEAARAKVAERLAGAEGELGMSLRELISSLASLNGRFDGMTTPAANQKPEPLFTLQADLGQTAARILPLILKKDPKGSEAVTLAGADEAIRPTKRDRKALENMVLARYGNRLVGSNHAQQPAPRVVESTDADLRFTMDYRAFMKIAGDLGNKDPEEQAVLKAMLNTKGLDPYLAPFNWEIKIVPEGLRERISQEVIYPGVRPIDRSLFNRLPDNTMMAFAIGYDSKSYWSIFEPMLLEVLAVEQPDLTREQLIAAVEEQMTDLGLQLTFPDLVQAIDGTIMIAITPGAPFPGVTVVVPRSKAVDNGLQFAASTLQWEMPAEGASGPVSIPEVPLPLTLIADQKYWVITSDPNLQTAWSAGGKGWSTSPAMTLALQQAVPDAAMIGASDTNAVLRTLSGFLALIPFPDAKDKQTATVLLARASAAAGTGYLVGQQRGKTWEVEARGLLGFGVFPAMAAAIAIPNLIKNRDQAAEMTIVNILRNQVFAAQIQFQASGYADQDGDSNGEYGFFSEMAGGAIVGQSSDVTLEYLTEGWNVPYPVMNGYQFACWLPDGKGGALGADGVRAKDANAAKAQSERFVVYAWPVDDAELPVYALTHTGMIYSSTGVTIGVNGPTWNALFNGGGWDAEPVWKPYQRR